MSSFSRWSLTVLCIYSGFCCFYFSLLNLVTIMFSASSHFLCLPPIIALYWLKSVFLGLRDMFDYNLILVVESHQLQFPSLLYLQVAVQSYCYSGLRIWTFSYSSKTKKFNWMTEIEKCEKKLSYILNISVQSSIYLGYFTNNLMLLKVHQSPVLWALNTLCNILF